MIIYFSGTGNSEYVAKQIETEIGDKTLNLFQKLRDHDYARLESEKAWIVVVPTYAWRIPRLVSDWLMKTPLAGSKKIYFVMTCGENIGNAGTYLKKLCSSKQLQYMGCAQIVMPENYIAMFATPAQEEAVKIIQAAQGAIAAVCEVVKAGSVFPEQKITFQDRLCSGFVNEMFYPLIVHAKKFYATDTCISCGKCVKLCPMNNIQLKSGKPLWADHCTHCMACISRCPVKAIEYGKHSIGLPRYVFPSDYEI